MVLVVSCTEAKVKIRASGAESDIIKNTYIRTTEVNVNEDVQQAIKKPEINITSPKDGEVINATKIVIKLNISNFKLVTPDLYPKKGQGHVQVWFDNMEFRGSKSEFIFENESNGTHIIKAELMLSNNTILPYSDAIKIIINRTQ